MRHPVPSHFTAAFYAGLFESVSRGPVSLGQSRRMRAAARRADINDGIPALWVRLPMAIGGRAGGSDDISEDDVRDEVADYKQSEEHRAFGYAHSDAFSRFEAVPHPRPGRTNAAANLPH